MGARAWQLYVRAAVPEDAPAIQMVQAQTWLATYPNEALGITREGLRQHLEGSAGENIAEKAAQIRDRIESQVNVPASGRHFVAVLGGEIVGYTSPFIELSGRRRVGALYVLPAAQGRGIGRLLMAENLAWHGDGQDIYLHVAAYNDRARRFYRRHGFVLTGQPARSEVADGVIIPELQMLRRGKRDA